MQKPRFVPVLTLCCVVSAINKMIIKFHGSSLRNKSIFFKWIYHNEMQRVEAQLHFLTVTDTVSGDWELSHHIRLLWGGGGGGGAVGTLPWEIWINFQVRRAETIMILSVCP